MAAIRVGEHTIGIELNRLSGKEHVKYDGQDVSNRRNLAGVTHEFAVDEAGVQVQYEVDTSNKVFKSEISAIRRNGDTIYPSA